jgi:hypothetical protein
MTQSKMSTFEEVVNKLLHCRLRSMRSKKVVGK